MNLFVRDSLCSIVWLIFSLHLFKQIHSSVNNITFTKIAAIRKQTLLRPCPLRTRPPPSFNLFSSNVFYYIIIYIVSYFYYYNTIIIYIFFSTLLYPWLCPIPQVFFCLFRILPVCFTLPLSLSEWIFFFQRKII